MRERPLLMKGPLVRATLEGRKTQTRRPVKTESLPDPGFVWAECLCREIDPSDTPCPTCLARFPGIPEAGDRLWVRETWDWRDWQSMANRKVRIAYAADGAQVDTIAPCDWNPVVYNAARWHPSIHMPRWACRLVLPLVSVRVERVQDITEEDARAEGVPHNSDRPIDKSWCATCLGHGIVERFALGTASIDDCSECNTAKTLFRNCWISIYGQQSWDANPWVWVAEWKEIEVSR